MKISLVSCGLVFLFFLPACREEGRREWIPVLEPTGYTYLSDVVAEARGEIDQAAAALASGEVGPAARTLEKADHALLKVERYFLTMTEVRQLIYDADRLYFLGRTDEAGEKLRLALDLLIRVGRDGGESVARAVGEVETMVGAVALAMESEPEAVSAKMRLLGEKINLMVLKGELVLAGARFSE